MSLADAPSRVLAEQVLTGLSVGEARAGLPFRLEAPAGDPGVAYALSVHADLDGDGAISHGDYINYESYPVPSDRPAVAMVVRVRPVHGRRAPSEPGPT